MGNGHGVDLYSVLGVRFRQLKTYASIARYYEISNDLCILGYNVKVYIIKFHLLKQKP